MYEYVFHSSSWGFRKRGGGRILVYVFVYVTCMRWISMYQSRHKCCSLLLGRICCSLCRSLQQCTARKYCMHAAHVTYGAAPDVAGCCCAASWFIVVFVRFLPAFRLLYLVALLHTAWSLVHILSCLFLLVVVVVVIAVVLVLVTSIVTWMVVWTGLATFNDKRRIRAEVRAMWITRMNIYVHYNMI